MSRPEHISPPELFYDEKEAAKYNSSSRIIKVQVRATVLDACQSCPPSAAYACVLHVRSVPAIALILLGWNVQEELANRAIELLNLPEDQEHFILDVGCGSGLSGVALEQAGHAWVGVDISKDMLDIASERDSSGDVFLQDMGGGLPFRPGVFDGCISISAIQWLCYSDKKEHTARKRLTRFFTSLYTCLKRGSRAVLQLYPETPEQMEEISGCAMRCGFSGGLVIDFPNSAKAKKFYLCLFAGYDATPVIPKGLGTGEDAGASSEISFEARRKQLHQRRGTGREPVKVKDWVLAKKERYRKQGKKVKADSKFTGRRRPSKF